MALASGKSIRWVADQLGHANPEPTLRTYSHVMRSEEADLSFADFGSPKRPDTALGSGDATTKTPPTQPAEGIHEIWSARRGSNSRPSAWEADALPTELLARRVPESHRSGLGATGTAAGGGADPGLETRTGMTLTEARAEELLRIRNESFMTADIEAYMALWNDDGVIEMGAQRFVGGAAIRAAVGGAWAVSRVLHFETRSFAVRGDRMLNEFAIVWQDKATETITLQTGMGVIEVAANGRFQSLRDYMEATDGVRESAAALPAVRGLLG